MSDIFVKLDGIPGECTDEKHKDWIEVLSYNHGVSQASAGSRSTGGAASASRCNHSDFSFVKCLDKTSAKLNLACCKGTHIKAVEVALCRATGEKTEYMRYKLEDVMISGVRPGGSAQGGSDVPLEDISLNYGKITWTYTETDHKTGKPGGKVTANWSTVENKGS